MQGVGVASSPLGLSSVVAKNVLIKKERHDGTRGGVAGRKCLELLSPSRTLAGAGGANVPPAGACLRSAPRRLISVNYRVEAWLRRGHIDPPRRAERKNLEGNEDQVCGAFVYNDVSVVAPFVDEGSAGYVNNA